ncbi:MAG: lipid droplet-associated protein, partial [Mycobacteriaceae bacterium]|nr:lipid droplet-associated protein [Mycobacteriaceae bacterium]
ASAPYGVRLLVGAATVAVEETMKLPRTILMYPITLVSQAAHLVMLFQQNVAELVIKGDSTLEILFPPKDEQPAWAVFDEDLLELNDTAPGHSSSVDGADDERRTEGRFALYSIPAPVESAAYSADLTASRSGQESALDEHKDVPPPAVAIELNYPTLTLAQLRPRLQSLDVDELQTLLAYEQATAARPPFETLITNRITRATAK